VHGMLTYRLALAAGFPKADAARLAIATAGMDHDKATMPGGPGDFAQLRGRAQTVKYHYPEGGFAEALGRVDANIAEQKDRHRKRQGDDIERFGQSLHTLEDIGFKEAPGPHMRTDPGKPATRILSATIGVVGLDVAVAAFGSMAHLLSSGAGADGKLFGGALLGLLGGFGIYMIIVAFYTRDLGHPSYKTERGEFSDSLHHTADQAPQDPVRNTAEMLRVYDKLKEYAHARYGRAAKANDKLAAAAIQQAVEADSACKVNNFANERPLDARGRHVPAYSEILSTRTKDAWAPEKMDVTLPRGMGDWKYRPGVQACH